MIYHILENFKYGKSSEFLYCNIFANIYPVGSYNSDSSMFLCVFTFKAIMQLSITMALSFNNN